MYSFNEKKLFGTRSFKKILHWIFWPIAKDAILIIYPTYWESSKTEYYEEDNTFPLIRLDGCMP